MGAESHGDSGGGSITSWTQNPPADSVSPVVTWNLTYDVADQLTGSMLQGTRGRGGRPTRHQQHSDSAINPLLLLRLEKHAATESRLSIGESHQMLYELR